MIGLLPYIITIIVTHYIMEDKHILNENLEIACFNTLNNTKLFGMFNPNTTTLEQIRKSFLDNYECKDLSEDQILLNYSFVSNDGVSHVINLNELDQNLTMLALSQMHSIKNTTRTRDIKISVGIKPLTIKRNININPKKLAKSIRSNFDNNNNNTQTQIILYTIKVQE